MKVILSYSYNFEEEIERQVFSELLSDAITRINYVITTYPKLTQDKVQESISVVGKVGGNTDLLRHFLEHRMGMDKTFREDIKDLVNKYSIFLSSNPRLQLKLSHNDSVIDRNFNEATLFLSQMLKEVKSQNGGCYIATMAYGNYDHPQVIKLRNFRDESLSRTIPGRAFIKLYYVISPILVEVFKNSNGVNKTIRKGLDLFIKLIGR
jgi:hypothetical protein